MTLRRCPAASIVPRYSSDAAKRASLQEFIKSYTTRFPQKDVRDIMIARYRLLVAHSCIETLKSMLAHVAPVSVMLRFNGQDFGPRTEEYDPDTDVWTVWFRKDGDPPALSVEDLIFNFYRSPGVTPEGMANAFASPRPHFKVLGEFQAPDELTKRPAFFIVSQTLYSDESYGYVDVSKITSVGARTYTVTFAKKITGTSMADIEQKGKAWFISPEGRQETRTLDQVSADPSWDEYFAQKRQ